MEQRDLLNTSIKSTLHALTGDSYESKIKMYGKSEMLKRTSWMQKPEQMELFNMNLTENEIKEWRSHPSTKEMLTELKVIRQLNLEKVLHLDSADVDAAIGMVLGISLAVDFLQGIKDE